jgi:hypothetical protein
VIEPEGQWLFPVQRDPWMDFQKLAIIHLNEPKRRPAILTMHEGLLISELPQKAQFSVNVAHAERNVCNRS